MLPAHLVLKILNQHSVSYGPSGIHCVHISNTSEDHWLFSHVAFLMLNMVCRKSSSAWGFARSPTSYISQQAGISSYLTLHILMSTGCPLFWLSWWFTTTWFLLFVFGGGKNKKKLQNNDECCFYSLSFPMANRIICNKLVHHFVSYVSEMAK